MIRRVPVIAATAVLLVGFARMAGATPFEATALPEGEREWYRCYANCSEAKVGGSCGFRPTMSVTARSSTSGLFRCFLAKSQCRADRI